MEKLYLYTLQSYKHASIIHTTYIVKILNYITHCHMIFIILAYVP